MDWARMLAYVTGSVDQELLALAAENRILRVARAAEALERRASYARRDSWFALEEHGFRSVRRSGRRRSPQQPLRMQTVDIAHEGWMNRIADELADAFGKCIGDLGGDSEAHVLDLPHPSPRSIVA